MSLQDSLFSEDVEHDVTLFSRDKRRKRVLVFPPVNNYRRYIIHQLVRDRFPDLLYTFSIGQGAGRRLIVCYKSDVIRDPKLNGVDCKPGFTTKSTDTREMGVEGRRSPSASPERVRVQRPVKSVPAVEIYRPPAARRAKNDQINAEQVQVQSTDSPLSAKNNRQRRPDRAVYVPRHRRSLEPEGSPQPLETSRSHRAARENLTPSASHGTSKPNLSPKEQDSCCTQQIVEVARKGSNSCDSRRNGSCSSQNSSENEVGQCFQSGSKSTASLETPAMETCDRDGTKRLDCAKEIVDSIVSEVECERTEITQTAGEERVSVKSLSENKLSLDPIDAYVHSDVIAANEHLDSSDKYEDDVVVSPATTNNQKDEQFLNKDELANQKNTEMVRRNVVSDVLIISDSIHKKPKIAKDIAASVPTTPPQKKVKKIERPKSKPAPPPSPPVKKVNRDECDWDSLFDDNGDCLDPSLIEELTSAVGEVMIEQPKNDYKAFTKHVEVSSDEFAHVVEIYNFPSEFKTSDLAAAFSPFKNGGFELKWVDDTHCLGVFSSPLIAAEVLASDHPFVKTRPLSEATALSKTKAKRSAEFLQPYRSRPETCAALARRLVTGALGVKLATARQEREHEKNVLREAKEKRRLANKQREDAWEGIIPEK